MIAVKDRVYENILQNLKLISTNDIFTNAGRSFSFYRSNSKARTNQKYAILQWTTNEKLPAGEKSTPR